VYAKDNTLVRFTSDLVNKVRKNKEKAIFTCLKDDIKTNYIEECSMQMDEVLTFPDLHQKFRKHRIGKIAGSVSLATGLLGSFFFLGESSITGMAPLAVSKLNGQSYIGISLLLFLVGFTYIYRKDIFPKTYKINKPKKPLNKKKIKTDFKNKINTWLNKISMIF